MIYLRHTNVAGAKLYQCQIPAVLWLGTADNWQVLWVRCKQSTDIAKQHKTCGNSQQLLTLFRVVKDA